MRLEELSKFLERQTEVIDSEHYIIDAQALYRLIDHYKKLILASETLLSNLIDAGEYGPAEEPEDTDKFIKDEDGDLWYPDIWKLNEALE